MRNQFRTLGGYGKNLNRSLPTEELRAFAPSVFADVAHSRTSSRYSFLPTSSILEGMEDEGWLPVAAQEQIVRDKTRNGFQKHMIRFAHRDDLANPKEDRAEIVLLNSHDRTSSYQLHAGIFRFVCANGLVVCDETFARQRIQHQGFNPSKVIEASVELAAQIPALMDGIQEMKLLRLTIGERMAFAESAAILRWGDLDKAPVRPEKLLTPRRNEDNIQHDTWTTFNVIQENCVRGGQMDYAKRKPNGERMPKSREVKGIDGNVQLNKALWHLTEQMKALKAQG